MKSPTGSGSQRTFWDRLTLCVFLTLLWLPTLDYFLKLDHARPTLENRRLALWPRFEGIGRTRDFVAGLESYFNDHFGFRKRLIRWNSHWRDQFFKETSRRDALVGREGWLFYSGSHMIEDWTRQAAWSRQEFENWRRLLEMRRDWLRARGIKYLFVVPPDKQTVYPEFLPDWLERSAQPSKIQQLAEYLKGCSTVEVLDLSGPLIDAKNAGVEYLKTDTHWNLFGGFVGCRAVVAALAHQLPALAPLPAKAYGWKQEEQPPGDLTIQLGGTELFKETTAVEPVPSEPLPALKVLYDPARFPQRDEKEHKPCYTFNENAAGKALLFRDSFARAWYPFLGQHFREVIYIWHPEWDRPLIEREKPDVVIDEMLERIFNEQDPVALARLDRMSETNSPIPGASSPARYPVSPRTAASRTNDPNGSAR